MDSYSSFAFGCFCGQTYNNAIDLEEHRRARGHFVAHVCGPSCKHPPISQSPIRVQFCSYCDKKCERDDILQDHRIFTGHCFCSECDRSFDSQAALQAHLRSQIHASEFRCCDCNIAFNDIHALNAHMASRAHRKPIAKNSGKPESTKMTKNNDKHLCQDCNRTFKSTNSLLQHRESVKHKPLSNLSCPVGKKCKVCFTSPSALIQHLESGECDSGITREKIYQLVQNHDTDNLIHKTPEGITPSSPRFPISDNSLSGSLSMTPDLSDDTSCWPLLTPPSGLTLDEDVTEWLLISGSQTPVSDSQYSLNAPISRKLECPLCPTQGKKFATSQALENHMKSPIHRPKVYYCPVSMFPVGLSFHQRKQQKFLSTLGGLAQHLESGACQGGKDIFIEVVGFIERRLELFGFRSMPLLLSRC